jgi:CheY-like chemotaxis protein
MHTSIVNQKVLRKQLLKLDYKVSIANHGVEALSFLQTTRFAKEHHEAGTGVDLSVVLMDSEMPIMVGARFPATQ